MKPSELIFEIIIKCFGPRSILVGLVFFLTLFSGGLLLAADRPEDLTPKLQTILDRSLANSGAPGGVLAVRFPDGREVILASGKACLGDGRPMTQDLHFRIGSITKTFTATGVLLLVEDGLIGLDDSLEKLLPGLIPNSNGITVKMLLDHTSGLYDFTRDEAYQDEYLDHRLRVWTPSELVAIAAEHDRDFAPGQKWSYSNTGYVLLGLIIEKASGLKVEDFISQRILNPLNLTNTSFPGTSDMPEPYACGYLDFKNDGRWIPEDEVTVQDPSAVWAAGAMISTPKDLLTWIDALVTGKLLDSKTHQAQMAFDVRVPEELSHNSFFGLGLANNDGFVGHTGAIQGYTTIMYSKNGLSIVAYTNGYFLNETNAANDIFEDAAGFLFSE